MTTYAETLPPAVIEGFDDLDNLMGEALLKRRTAEFIQVSQLTEHEIPHGVTPMIEAWRLLKRAQDKTRDENGDDVINTLLEDPSTGGWLGHCRDRLFDGKASSDETPMGVHAMYVHSLAASACIKAGLECEIDVMAWDGSIILPTIGRITLNQPNEDQAHQAVWMRVTKDCVAVKSDDKLVSIPRDKLDEPTESWTPISYITEEIDDTSKFHIALDDINPYRRPGGYIKPGNDIHRLANSQDRQLWVKSISDAVHELATHHPIIAKQIAQCIHSIIPLAYAPRALYYRPYSASGSRTIGSAELNWQNDSFEMMLSLVHEAAHNSLYASLQEYPLTNSRYDDIPCFYAPWRDDPRPAAGTLQGLKAFSAVMQFCEEYAQRHKIGTPEHYLAVFNRHHWNLQRNRAKTQLKPDSLYINRTQRNTARAVGDVAISADLLEAMDIVDDADRAASYHWTRWMGHHLKPDGDQLEDLFDIWLRRRQQAYHTLRTPLPIKELDLKISHEVEARYFDIFAQLFRLQHTQPKVLKYMYLKPEKIPNILPGATHADVCLFVGDMKKAEKLYLERLNSAEGYDDVQAMVGLGYKHMALPSLRDDSKADNEIGKVLYQHPYLYRAMQRMVMRELGHPEKPESLIRWLGQLPLKPVTPASLKPLQEKLLDPRRPPYLLDF